MAAANPSKRFLPHGPFHAEVQRRVDAHFASRGIAANEAPAMYFKTAVILSWFAGSYLLLVLWASNGWEGALLSVSLGLAMAGIGFNIQHDGNHGGYSRRRGLNRVMACSLDLLGGSSYIWNWKHNVFHHSNPNVDGLDADIDLQPFCRLSPLQRPRAVHRFQHLYIWFLYSLLSVKWQCVDDFVNVGTGKIGGMKFPRPRGWARARLMGGKLLFLTWALLIPLWTHPFWEVAFCAAIASVTLSLTLALTFQLAHSVEGASFPSAEAGAPATDWAAHQVATSVDFAPHSRFLTWYLGGLNFQIEHHLFPRACHLHLGEISGIVRDTCQEFGLDYRVNPTLWSALCSHARWLRRLGHPELPAAAAEAA